jgi:glycine cleavage system H protein
MATVLYKRATFVTHLPLEHRYTPSHCWLAEAPGITDHWRVGYTKFALRMLGEIVDVQLDKKAGEELQPGDVVGSIEGFKAISDIFCVGTGKYVRGNPDFGADLNRLAEQPYTEGWLYEFEGVPDPRALDVQGYRNLLDATIDRMLQKEREFKAQP